MVLSAILLIPGIVAMVYSSVTYPNHAPMKVGIDYTGGTILQYGLKQKITNNDLTATRANLEKIGVENPYLQILNVNNTQQEETKNNISSIISIRTKFIGESSEDVQNITNALSSQFENPELIQVSSVGPVLGKQLFVNSMIAVALALLGIVIYLTLRFHLEFALVAFLALFHDVIFVIGVFSILGLMYGVHIDSLFVTAILTVLGFSVHDTIVVCFIPIQSARA